MPLHEGLIILLFENGKPILNSYLKDKAEEDDLSLTECLTKMKVRKCKNVGEDSCKEKSEEGCGE
ncbi:hypothetical protein KI387_036319, partial [Taxus chinensis]